MKHLRKILLLGVLALLLALPTTAQSPTGVFARVTAVIANVRDFPNVTSSTVLLQLREGAFFPVLEQSNDGNWYLLDLQDIGFTRGWIFGPLVQIVDVGVVPRGLGVPPSAGPVVILENGVRYTVPQIDTPTIGVLPPEPQQPNILANTQPIALGNVNMRTGPSTDFPITWRVAYGNTVTLLGRNSFGNWFFVNDSGREGWVAAQFFLLPVNFDLNAVPIVG